MSRKRTIAVCVVTLGLIAASGLTAQAASSEQGGTPSAAPTGQETHPASTEPPGRLGTVTPIVGTPAAVRPTSTLLPAPGSETASPTVMNDAIHARINRKVSARGFMSNAGSAGLSRKPAGWQSSLRSWPSDKIPIHFRLKSAYRRPIINCTGCGPVGEPGEEPFY